MENDREAKKIKQLARVYAENAMNLLAGVPLPDGMNTDAVIVMGINSLFRFPDDSQHLQAMEATFGDEVDQTTAFVFTEAREAQAPFFRADMLRAEKERISETLEPEGVEEGNIPMAEVYARIVDKLAGFVDEPADLLPTQARSRDIAKQFEKAGAPTLAKLCSIPRGLSEYRLRKHNLH